MTTTSIKDNCFSSTRRQKWQKKRKTFTGSLEKMICLLKW